jgi:3-(3-hydroxy-phenyl)propionate hydroxylase
MQNARPHRADGSLDDRVYDVIVVGFGPAGATLANLLGQCGIDTLVVDKSSEIYELPRAFALDHEIMRTFQNLGFADRVLPYTRPFTASEYYGVDGQLIKRLGSVAPPYPMAWHPNLVFSQPPVERVMRDAAGARSSVELALGMELVAIRQDGHGVTAEFHDEQKASHIASARYLVGCDGAWSTVRALAGLQYEDLEFDEPWLVVDLLVNDEGLKKLPDVSIQYCEPARPCTYLVGPENHRRWEIMVMPGEDRRELESDANVWRLLARWLSPSDATLWRRASYQFHALAANDWRNGRVFIAGDAAHQQPPFTGQGMCQGVRDVANLAWKLERVLKHGAADALLDSYTAERKAHVRRLTTVIKGIGALICERDPVRARERDARLIAEAGGKVVTVPRQELIPPLERGCLSAQAHPANGTLFPQPIVRDASAEGDIARLDDLTGACLRIVADDDACLNDPRIATLVMALDARTVCVGSLGAPPAAKHSMAQRSTSEPLVVSETEGVVGAWFTRHRCHAAIVRPDHYVYGVAADADALVTQLESLVTALGESQLSPPSTLSTSQRSAA